MEFATFEAVEDFGKTEEVIAGFFRLIDTSLVIPGSALYAGPDDG